MKKKFIYSGIAAALLLIAGVMFISATPSEKAAEANIELDQSNCVCPSNSTTIAATVVSVTGTGCYRLLPCSGSGSSVAAITASTTGPLVPGRTYKMCVVRIGNTICASNTLLVVCASAINGCP